MAASREDAARRLEDIKRGLEVKRQENLLALSEQRERGRLTVQKARNNTTFAARDAWLRQTADRQKVLDQYEKEMEEYRSDMAQYQRDVAAYNQRLDDQRRAERGQVIGTVTGGLMDALFRRR